MGESQYDVVIVGAGAIGCCAAVHLAPDHDVLVLEKDEITNSASANASAHISDWWFFLEGEFIPGVTAAIRSFFDDLDGTAGFTFHDRDFVTLIDDAETDSPEVQDMRASAEQIDGISYYTADELADRYPGVLHLEGVSGAVVDEHAGYVEPRSYLRAMKTTAEADGAEFRTGTEVTDIHVEDGTVAGVGVDGAGRIEGDNVVVAAGTGSAGLLADFVDLPVRPFVIYEAEVEWTSSSDEPIPTTAGRGTLVGVNEAGNLLVGDEYWVDDIANVPAGFPQEAKEKIADRLPQMLQGIGTDYDYVEGSSHRCPEGITITPDQLPVIDTVPGAEGLVVADGSRGAVSLAPPIALAIRALLTGEETPFSLDRFELGRFESEEAAFDLPMITEPR